MIHNVVVTLDDAGIEHSTGRGMVFFSTCLKQVIPRTSGVLREMAMFGLSPALSVLLTFLLPSGLLLLSLITL